MRLAQLYSDSIKHFSEPIQESLIREAPHTRVSRDIPAELSFLVGSWIDLGFENLGLSAADHTTLLRAFIGAGVRVPNTEFRLRYAKQGYTIAEPADGTEVGLPDDWAEGVLVLDANDKPTHVGKLVRRSSYDFQIFGSAQLVVGAVPNLRY